MILELVEKGGRKRPEIARRILKKAAKLKKSTRRRTPPRKGKLSLNLNRFSKFT